MSTYTMVCHIPHLYSLCYRLFLLSNLLYVVLHSRLHILTELIDIYVAFHVDDELLLQQCSFAHTVLQFNIKYAMLYYLHFRKITALFMLKLRYCLLYVFKTQEYLFVQMIFFLVRFLLTDENLI